MIFFGENSKKENTNRQIAFDVDGTLIDQDGKPRYEIIEIYRMFESLGCHMIIWSGGGENYAQNIANRLGLKAEIIRKCHKDRYIDIAFDDVGIDTDNPNINVTTCIRV